MATAGCRAFTTELRSVAWPGKFKPALPPRYDGTFDPTEFLQLYELGIKAANGDEKVMANWFPMALKDGAHTWLLKPGPRHDLLLGRDAHPLHRQLLRYLRPATCRERHAPHQATTGGNPAEVNPTLLPPPPDHPR